ncbi:conserved Plasmodium protein, unknown function [Babesia microti strain RI]|uniref:Uncharacterized protein n=1 Tax=Babesia microti (strain RI) TaxID=1133968 RepID=A0A1N6LWG7_BABMR|nr:conserved Plasmodium protein, unknown function [Babesia microti strain RI]SIO73209.1 conserved Plasmodium protein, unknown function [Babesia microti strain RI]|eukprot:XP_021337317.1 conserved Plasmodium protein, unknown function [Babesia microti strain RI]
MLENLPIYKTQAKYFVDFVEQNGIKMVCFDFDNTIIDQHTSGSIPRDIVTSVKNYITEDFRLVAKELISRGIKIAVVTFSDVKFAKDLNKTVGGELLVKEVLADICPDILIYARYPRYYQKPSEYEKIGLKEPMHISKNYHLQQAANDSGFALSEIILIDDDINNCEHAHKLGVLAFHVFGDMGFKLSNIKSIQSARLA